jgi:hypothetical protein
MDHRSLDIIGISGIPSFFSPEERRGDLSAAIETMKEAQRYAPDDLSVRAKSSDLGAKIASAK